MYYTRESNHTFVFNIFIFYYNSVYIVGSAVINLSLTLMNPLYFLTKKYYELTIFRIVTITCFHGK